MGFYILKTSSLFENIVCPHVLSFLFPNCFVYKQNWMNHLERMDNTRLPKHALNFEPRGRKDLGHPKKRWQRVDTGTGQAA
jgi:hypothetical protein